MNATWVLTTPAAVSTRAIVVPDAPVGIFTVTWPAPVPVKSFGSISLCTSGARPR